MFKKMKVKLRLLQSASPMKLILAGYLTIILIGTLLLLLRNGADYVSYAEREVAERLAIKFGADTIFDYVELTPEIGIYEIAVPKKWIGKNMVELSIRNKYHVSVMATKKGNQIFPLPHPSHVFEPDESVMVMGSAKDIGAIT